MDELKSQQHRSCLACPRGQIRQRTKQVDIPRRGDGWLVSHKQEGTCVTVKGNGVRGDVKKSHWGDHVWAKAQGRWAGCPCGFIRQLGTKWKTQSSKSKMKPRGDVWDIAGERGAWAEGTGQWEMTWEVTEAWVPSEVLDLMVIKREMGSHRESGSRNSGLNLCFAHHSVSAGEHGSTGCGYNSRELANSPQITSLLDGWLTPRHKNHAFKIPRPRSHPGQIKPGPAVGARHHCTTDLPKGQDARLGHQPLFY